MKAVKYAPWLFLSAWCLIFASCDEGAHPDFYEGCCGTESVNYTVNNFPLYIPNVFTPNDDGENDRFFPRVEYSNSGEIEIREFIITSPAGEVLFEAYDLLPNDPTFGWNGIVYPSRHEYVGLFHYKAVIFEGAFGTTLIINSKACAIRCDTDITVNIENFGTCKFNNQHNGQGRYNPFLPSKETECN